MKSYANFKKFRNNFLYSIEANNTEYIDYVVKHCSPSLHGDALEDCEHGISNVVEADDALFGSLPVGPAERVVIAVEALAEVTVGVAWFLAGYDLFLSLQVYLSCVPLHGLNQSVEIISIECVLMGLLWIQPRENISKKLFYFRIFLKIILLFHLFSNFKSNFFPQKSEIN